MTFSIVFRRAAKVEFEKAAVWYDEQRPGLGEEFMVEIEQAIVNAAAGPLRYQLVFGDIRRAVARHFSYSVYFRGRSTQFVVRSVFHGRRDPDDLAATGLTPGGTDGQKRPAAHYDVRARAMAQAAPSTDDQYRRAFRNSIVAQAIFGVLAVAAMFPGSFTLWLIAMAAYWTLAISIVAKRAKKPTDTDIVIIHWGFPIIFIAGAVIWYAFARAGVL